MKCSGRKGRDRRWHRHPFVSVEFLKKNHKATFKSTMIPIILIICFVALVIFLSSKDSFIVKEYKYYALHVNRGYAHRAFMNEDIAREYAVLDT